MARCLRCRAGNEWIEGEPAPEDKERVAELERQHIDSQAQLMVERRELLAKLVAAQATISRKDEALKLGLRLCAIADHRDRTADGSIQFGRMLSEFRDTARAALPSDRTALDAMLAEARKEQRENDAKICEANQVNKSPDYLPGTVFDGACRQCADAIRQAAERSADNAELCGRRET